MHYLQLQFVRLVKLLKELGIGGGGVLRPSHFLLLMILVLLLLNVDLMEEHLKAVS